MHLPGGTRRKGRRKGGDEGAGSLASSQTRLSRLKVRSRGCPCPVCPREPKLAFFSSPLPQSKSPHISSPSRTTLQPRESPSLPRASRPAPARLPHPLRAGSIPGLLGEGVRDRVASAPCRLSGHQEAASLQTPAGLGRPCRWAGAERASRAPPSARPPRRGR